MIDKFKKNETLFVISFIIIYVVSNSYMMQNFGYTSYVSAIVNTLFSILLFILIVIIKRVKYYGITKPINSKELLYFIPLFIISFFNLRGGVSIKNSSNEIIFYVLTMINIGFLEEILFRGFLFKMMEKDNVRSAIIVSSITFGLGHIVNLLNGADFLSTLFQIFYAISIGYMLVMVFYKSKSIIPCILFHSVFNCLSIFGNTTTQIWSTLLLLVLCFSYGFYLDKRV